MRAEDDGPLGIPLSITVGRITLARLYPLAKGSALVAEAHREINLDRSGTGGIKR
jgi:hypothetical protein